jgi:hypothetical protein
MQHLPRLWLSCFLCYETESERVETWPNRKLKNVRMRGANAQCRKVKGFAADTAKAQGCNRPMRAIVGMRSV